MDNLPPVVTPASQNNTIPPVKISRHPPLFLIIPTLIIGLIVIIVLVLVFLKPNRQVVTPVAVNSPAPTLSATISATPVISGQPGLLAPPRLPLTTLAGHQLLTSSDNKLWLTDFTPQGPRKSLLLDVGNRIEDISLSPNHQLLAFTYSGSDSGSAATFPNTGLKVLDIATKTATEFVALGNLQIRRPTWSADSVYLAVWNNGTSSMLFDMTNKRRVKEITATGSNVGQIVFVPGQTKYSYATSGSLYEVPYTIDEPVKILDGINSLLSLPDTLPLPDFHLYPGSSEYILYHNSRKQLVLFDRRDSSSQILAESSAVYPYGGVVAHDAIGKTLIYFNLNQEKYTPGTDDNPLMTYDLAKRTGKPFFANPKTRMSLGLLMPDPNHRYLLVEDVGFKVYSLNTTMESDCNYTILNNDQIYNPETLWSPDSKYVLSTNTIQIADAFSCAITTEFDSVTPDLAVWLK